jgi:hypothetical protein
MTTPSPKAISGSRRINPVFPNASGVIGDAIGSCRTFVDWYKNHVHHVNAPTPKKVA